MRPKVSVIIPNYNHAPYLEQRIESVLNQTFQDFEVILMDDCSTDHSVEILQKYADHPKVSHLLLNEQNSGSTFRQWKKGLEHAKGEYIWLAESDDWAELSFLEESLKMLEHDQKVGLSYCRTIPVNEYNQVIGDNDLKYFDDLSPERWHSDFKNHGKDEIKNYLSKKCTIPNASAILFRKEVFEHVDFNFNFKLFGDWFIYMQILWHYDLVYSSCPLNYQRGHANNVRSRTNKLQNLTEQFEFLKVSKRHFLGVDFNSLKGKSRNDFFFFMLRSIKHRRFATLYKSIFLITNVI